LTVPAVRGGVAAAGAWLKCPLMSSSWEGSYRLLRGYCVVAILYWGRLFREGRERQLPVSVVELL
jgi:hypothetical protein